MVALECTARFSDMSLIGKFWRAVSKSKYVMENQISAVHELKSTVSRK